MTAASPTLSREDPRTELRAPLAEYVPVLGVDLPIPEEAQPSVLAPDALQVSLTSCRDGETGDAAVSVRIRNATQSTVYLFPNPRSGRVVWGVGFHDNVEQGGYVTSSRTCSEGPCQVDTASSLAPGSTHTETFPLDLGSGSWQTDVALAASAVRTSHTPSVTSWPCRLQVDRANSRHTCANTTTAS